MSNQFLIQLGAPAPPFDLPCVDPTTGEIRQVALKDYAGRWLILIYYPRDFSFVCPTELSSFSAHLPDFQRLGCEVLGVSIDSIDSHREWLSAPPEEGGLTHLRFPLASDEDGETARSFGIWSELDQLPYRGLFVIDPDGRAQYVVVHNLNVGRNADEVRRVVEALQTGGLCPASWTTSEGTIDIEQMLSPGRVLGHFRIREVVGKGGFSTVFAATDLRLEREVALKVLNRTIDESLAAVLAEARLVAAIDHPNVCTIYSVEEHDGLPVIAMQYIAGRSLRSEIADGLPATRVRALAAEIAAGLAAAHDKPVVHGDLKPANILVSRDGVPAIVDFGLAATREPQNVVAWLSHDLREGTVALTDGILRDDSLAETDQVHRSARGLFGTPAYMSPEQSRGESPTPKSDVFSLGLILYEMQTRRRLLNEDNLSAILKTLDTVDLRHRAGEAFVGQVPLGVVEELTLAMLARSPDERPTSRDVAARLAENR